MKVVAQNELLLEERKKNELLIHLLTLRKEYYKLRSANEPHASLEIFNEHSMRVEKKLKEAGVDPTARTFPYLDNPALRHRHSSSSSSTASPGFSRPTSPTWEHTKAGTELQEKAKRAQQLEKALKDREATQKLLEKEKAELEKRMEGMQSVERHKNEQIKELDRHLRGARDELLQSQQREQNTAAASNDRLKALNDKTAANRRLEEQYENLKGRLLDCFSKLASLRQEFEATKKGHLAEMALTAEKVKGELAEQWAAEVDGVRLQHAASITSKLRPVKAELDEKEQALVGKSKQLESLARELIESKQREAKASEELADVKRQLSESGQELERARKEAGEAGAKAATAAAQLQQLHEAYNQLELDKATSEQRLLAVPPQPCPLCRDL